MKKLLNTLYVTSENSYLSLDGENVVVLEDQKELGRIPLHNLEGIVSFGYRGTSPALMGACADGSLRGSEYFSVLPHASGKIPGPCIRKDQRKCDIKRTAVCE